MERLYHLANLWFINACLKVYDWTGYVLLPEELLAVVGICLGCWIGWEVWRWPRGAPND